MDVLSEAIAWGAPIALATVVQTWGSSPQPVGSQLLVTPDGRMAGSVSGGCVESAVAEAALHTLASGERRLLEFGVTNDQAWEVGLACGGQLTVLVEPASPPLMAQLVAARTARRPAVVATSLDDGAQRLIVDPEAAADDGLVEAARECVRQDLSRRIVLDGGAWFLHLHAPSPRLILVGAVHIAQSLVPMAHIIQVDVVVCDPRRRYATAARFPSTRLRHQWPDEAVRLEQPDRNSALVALSHDPKLDDPALEAALATPCGYVGALGSRRSHASRLARLAERGVPEASLARILGPVGLDIHAVGAGEIAVSILGEWIAQRRGAALRPR